MSSFTKLIQAAGEENVIRDYSAASFTTFQAGGPVDYFITPENIQDLMNVLAVLKEDQIPFMVVGRGSNLLILDSGYRGAIICMRKYMNRIDVDLSLNLITAEGGAMMPEIAKKALENGLAGFEFASGIPGSIGGGLRMNAGAYGGELSQVVEEAVIIEMDGTIHTLKNQDLELGYRHSILEETNGIVLSVELVLNPGNPEEIREKMQDFNGRRRDKQPLEFASAGSTFKRPTGYFAGALIEEAGLKGFHIGDAYVSEKHAGFVVNKGKASANEIFDLTEEVIRIVQEKSGVTLEREVIVIGER